LDKDKITLDEIILENMDIPNKYVNMDKLNEIMINQKKAIQIISTTIDKSNKMLKSQKKDVHIILTMLEGNINKLCLRRPNDQEEIEMEIKMNNKERITQETSKIPESLRTIKTITPRTLKNLRNSNETLNPKNSNEKINPRTLEKLKKSYETVNQRTIEKLRILINPIGKYAKNICGPRQCSETLKDKEQNLQLLFRNYQIILTKFISAGFLEIGSDITSLSDSQERSKLCILPAIDLNSTI
jgi:hypothetical protein